MNATAEADRARRLRQKKYDARCVQSCVTDFNTNLSLDERVCLARCVDQVQELLQTNFGQIVRAKHLF